MTTTNIDSLVNDLRRLELLDEDQFAELERLLERSPSRDELAHEFKVRGWMTPYQISQFLNNKLERLSLGQYIMLEQLGSGGMGEVFKARHRLMHRVVALKVIRREHVSSQASLQRFHREIRAAAQLTHPNVVLAFDADQVGDTHFMVMEYVQGQDLNQLVKERGMLPVAWACEFIRQAAVGLHHAHERGLVHRDVKPSNLLLSWTEGVSHAAMLGPNSVAAVKPSMGVQAIVKVLDLGLARLREVKGHLTSEGQFMGTPDFTSPEQALDAQEADARADLYSLGCTLYYLLSGRVPFSGKTATEKLLKHQLEEAVPLLSHRPETPEPVAEIVHKLMAKKPADRYRSCEELVVALEPFCHSIGFTEFLQTPGMPTPQPVMDTDSGDIELPSLEQSRPGLAPTDSVAIDLLDPFGEASEKPSELRYPTPRPRAGARQRRRWLVPGLVILLITGALGASLFTLLSSGSTSSNTTQLDRPLAQGSSGGETGLGASPPTALTTGPRTTQPVSTTVPTIDAGDYALLLAPAEELGLLRTQLTKAGYDKSAIQALNDDTNSGEIRKKIAALLDREHWKGAKKETNLPNASVVIALSCPVVQFAGETECYLCPADANLADRSTLLPLKDIYSRLADCPAGFRLLLLDVSRQASRGNAGVNLAPACLPQLQTVPEGVVVFFSNSPGEVALDSGDTSASKFFATIARALKEESPDIEEYTQIQVFAEARRTPLRLGMTHRPVPVPAPGWASLLKEVPNGEVGGYTHAGAVVSVAFANDGTQVTSAGYAKDNKNTAGQLRLWQLDPKVRRGETEHREVNDYCVIRAVTLSPDGKYLLVGTGGDFDPEGRPTQKGNARQSKARVIRIKDPEERNASADKLTPWWVQCVAFSPDGKRIMAGCKQVEGDAKTGAVLIWKFNGKDFTLDEKSPLQRVSHKSEVSGKNDILSVAFAPRPPLAVYTAADGAICLWNTETGSTERDIVRGSAGKPAVRTSAFSPDGARLLTAGDDGALTLWEVATGKLIRTFGPEPASPVRSIAFSPDGRWALSGGEDGALHLWEVNSGKEVKQFEGHRDADGNRKAVNSVAYSPDGRYVLSGGDDKWVRLWALPRLLRH